MKELIQKYDPHGNIRGFTALALIVVLLAWAVIYKESNPTPIPQVTIAEVLENKEDYLDKTIILEGSVTKDLGERSYLLPYPYPESKPCISDPKIQCTTIKINFSHKRKATYEFTDQTGSLTAIYTSGGLYLPIPYSPAGSVKIEHEIVKIRGQLTQDGDGNYYFDIDEVIKMQADAP